MTSPFRPCGGYSTVVSDLYFATTYYKDSHSVIVKTRHVKPTHIHISHALSLHEQGEFVQAERNGACPDCRGAAKRSGTARRHSPVSAKWGILQGSARKSAELVHRLRLLRRPLHGPRTDDHVAERGPDERQVPWHLALRLLRLEPREAGGPGRDGNG